MSALAKLMLARAEFHASKIEKTGWNSFSKYKYFELRDFLLPALDIFAKHGLASLISFNHELATMTITDLEDGTVVVITSPMSSASLSAAHEIQNLGAVQTYLRRYLWVAALEIVEHDAIDSRDPNADKPKKRGQVHKPTDGAVTAEDRQAVIRDVAMSIIDHMRKDDTAGAYEEYIGITDPEEKTALWGLLEAPVRRQLKEYGSSIKD